MRLSSLRAEQGPSSLPNSSKNLKPLSTSIVTQNFAQSIPSRYLKLKINDKTYKKHSLAELTRGFSDINSRKEATISSKASGDIFERDFHSSLSNIAPVFELKKRHASEGIRRYIWVSIFDQG